ncbi:glucosaminidase domain-containing protein [Heliobacterium chlorum]|uniref:Glucosaminidase domain-containing protein n=1 Tax=Heliobacterium chlorum TaxID=2698 RepID=A0ABR7SYE9_HELCL|nr:glucosaminidase domain-containing protein [Heliobacterium chlorum]MBC9783060.1 glucosaminidase domain-containing protein [Heliobacterium chlorum]
MSFNAFTPGNPDSFIAAISQPAMQLQKEFQIFASIVIAQAALETGWGKFVPVDKNTGQFSYNLFGIKGTGPAGTIMSSTSEIIEGKRITIDAQFRSYHSWDESLRDHSQFLLNERYAPVREAQSPEDAAKQLYTCGYATDPDYPKKLISIINKYNLAKYDTPEIAKPDEPFVDVSPERWSYADIKTAFERGIFKGYEDKTFKPAEPLTREMAAVIVNRAVDYVLNMLKDSGIKISERRYFV